MSALGETAAGVGEVSVAQVPRAPSRVGAVVLATSLVVTAITVAAAGVVTLGLDDLELVVDDPHHLPPALDAVNSLARAGLLAVLAAWVATAWWLVDLRRVAGWAAPGYRHRRSDWWALAAWVVPIVNLWFPYQLVADSSRALGSRARTFWPWWIAWLLISTGTGFVSSPSSEEWTSPHDVEVWVTGMQLNAALTVVGLALWWRIVRAATRAAEAAVARD
ncbi:DUF4328 domain-containing protein [Janibacter indicus]|uniref:DUF4328 domain-containing protein n=1 Tax=Janibacter indicus TaxID=857417 RepID=UPI0009FFCEBB|nr:DUF4328 domain-containing protein [Janibacter indicus]